MNSPTDASTTARQPVLYLSHGAPPLAEDVRWPAELQAWSAGLARPSSILVVSAHWEAGAHRGQRDRDSAVAV